MGNSQSVPLSRTGGALDNYVSELGSEIVYDKSLGSARFLKTVKGRHRNGYVVIKLFIKPDPGLSLRSYHRRLKIEREALADSANIYNYQSFVETDRAGYIVRQWIASSLYDRISTRPFLSAIEKKWIAFQILNALRDARNRKISHGDIKSENVLVTSWNWVYLTDFASCIKPTYLPLDDPSDYSFFFDTSGRRTCYVAPERFYTAANNPEISAKKSRLQDPDVESAGKRDGKVTEAMDCFSAGCVLAELFLEGTPMFTLSQLFKYREGEFGIDPHLASIEDAGVRNVIKQMIALDPATRPTFDSLLHTSRGTVFPESFYSFLHNYVSTINELPTRSPFSTPSPQPPPSAALAPSLVPEAGDAVDGLHHNGITLPSDSDHRIERIWADFESVEPHILPEMSEDTVMAVKIEYTQSSQANRPFQDILPVELNIPNRDSKLRSALTGKKAASEDGPALIILALVCANIRNCRLPSSKIRALDVLLALSVHLTDEAKLDRLIPYIIDLLHDDSALVRATAIRSLLQVLMLVTVITPSNAAVFPEYIFPNLRHIVADGEVSVKCMYAQCIAPLAETAVRYLETGQAMKAHGMFKVDTEKQEYEEVLHEMSYDANLQDLQNVIEEHLSLLLMDRSSVVKRAVLHNISSLCVFFGRQKTNDVLLSHMITYLNDRDWLLRHAFFESVVDVAAVVGGRSVEEYLLPLMIQALSDVEETVVAKVLGSLTNLCELGLFQKMRIWELMSSALPFFYHPNNWIRQSAAAFIASAAKHLSTTDVWCILYPALKQYLRSDVHAIEAPSLLITMKSPLSRQIFDASVQWAMKADRTQFWKGHRRTASKLEPPKEGAVSVKKSGSFVARANIPKTEEDEAQLNRLQLMGMTPTEEVKLIALRDYIFRLSQAIASFTSRPLPESESEGLKAVGDVELQKLGVVPQTVFLKSRATEAHRGGHGLSSRRSNLEQGIIRKGLDTPRSNRTMSGEPVADAPFEDLRRRLATINGSSASLQAGLVPRERRTSAMLSPQNPTLDSPVMEDLPLPYERPTSPVESVVSGTNSSLAYRSLHRLQAGGSTDGQKAAPAIGSIRANATGVLEAAMQLRSDEPSERSGRSSPSPTGTVRGQQRPRLTSLVPLASYDGNDPAVGNLLEHMDLEHAREAQLDFGPHVHQGAVRRRNGVRPNFSTRDAHGRRNVEATLISHLSSHSDAITGLAVSPDHLFFVSASDDKTVKVWDTARLERNVTSKPRHTYGQHHARVKCICMLEGVHCFASAGEDGSLHVVRVHVSISGSLPKYTKLQVVREYRVDQIGEYITCMTHYTTETTSNLLYATTHSSIAILNLHTMQVLHSMENPRHHGLITTLCLDRKRSWLLVGTITGVLTLWDLRFGLLLKSWKVVAATEKPAGIHQCVVHPAKGHGKWIMVAVDVPSVLPRSGPSTLIEVWDIENTTVVETYAARTVADPSEPVDASNLKVDGVDAEPSPATAIANLVRARQSISASIVSSPRNSRSPLLPTALDMSLNTSSPTIKTLFVGFDFGGQGAIPRTTNGNPGALTTTRPFSRGFMITGSDDRRIRLWDLYKTEKSVALSGGEGESEKPTIRSVSDNPVVHLETWAEQQGIVANNRPPQRMALITQHQQNLLKAHHDAITNVVCIDSPFRGSIISGDRAGVIKVWRVDNLDG